MQASQSDSEEIDTAEMDKRDVLRMRLLKKYRRVFKNPEATVQERNEAFYALDRLNNSIEDSAQGARAAANRVVVHAQRIRKKQSVACAYSKILNNGDDTIQDFVGLVKSQSRLNVKKMKRSAQEALARNPGDQTL